MEGLKIVIADDEALIRLDLREMLTDAGHTVLGEAADGEEAVELAQRLKPDLVIMDVKMPKLDGITAAGIITERHIAPVLLLTAYSQQDVVEKANSSGVMAYLVKPVREEQLFASMQVAMARWRALRNTKKWTANWQTCAKALKHANCWTAPRAF